MNKLFNYTAHKRKWVWLSNNPDKDEKDWPEWNKYSKIPLNYCFACEFANGNCIYCPLGGRDINNKCLFGLIKLFKNTKCLITRKRIAKIISMLPI